MLDHAFKVVLAVSLLLNVILGAYLSMRSTSAPTVLERCVRHGLGAADTTQLTLRPSSGFCLDFFRDPNIEAKVSPCPTPGSIRVPVGIHVLYTNVALRAMKPRHLCLVDTAKNDAPIVCGRRNDDGTYDNWTVGTPGCAEKWFINGEVGVCLRPALRAPSFWLHEKFTALQPTPLGLEEETCKRGGVTFSVQNLDGFMSSRFFTTHREGGVMRHAIISGRNFFVLGSPGRQAIQDAIAEHETRIPLTDTVLTPESITVTNTRNLVEFTCRHTTTVLEIDKS